MKSITLHRLAISGAAALATFGLMAAPAAALTSRYATLSSASASAGSSTTSAADQARVTLIIKRGDSEITRRITTLNKLSNKISSAAKLSADDKSTLTSEVTAEISGLQTLKAKLDVDTDLPTAKTDAQSIFSEYRVYALVLPKVYLVKTADDQQTAESRLSALATKIQSDITADQQDGKDVTSLQTKLSDMTTKVQTAQGISSSIESKVINLQPSDYNSDHTVLSGDRDQLKTAQNDITGAITDARSLVSSLKTV